LGVLDEKDWQGLTTKRKNFWGMSGTAPERTFQAREEAFRGRVIDVSKH